ncbi:LOW QUALITY PROTEIN: uncharacterized protein LOC116300699 [Actinia tenebrosa]|uniref:LOW QUALITY PROTEIN: uncharacterized protein LOC116300699 n=1 Tax=Actinia tenebrosa TaxID=6105 RepID=A0A6P8IFL8_ACTTE|nr:LOW QUALITY PROTEIN: uncharacterized protein LOC116300699 [Actinia tenebrosa]
MVTDHQFEAMGLAIGETAMLRAMILPRNNDPQVNSPIQDNRKEEIRRAIDKIRNERKNVKKKEPASTKTESKVKQKKIRIGWLHRAQGARFKQVRRTGGGSIRQITYTDDNAITVEFLKSEGQRMFFPGGTSIHGPLKNMKVELGNFEQEPVDEFSDTEGKECTYPEYLRSRGLYASRSCIYLMTTEIPQQDDKKSDEKETPTSEYEPMTNVSTPKYGVYSAEGDYIDVKSNVLDITYEETKESSYSEVIMRSLSSCRHQCYDLQCLNDPFTQDTELDNYDPLENNFTVTEITKGNTCYIKRNFADTESEVSEESFSFPQCPMDHTSNEIILHPPSEVWGYDDNKLLLCVVAACHGDPAYYKWYLDGEIQIIKEGHGLCCLPVGATGDYKVEVQSKGKAEVSDSVAVKPWRSKPLPRIEEVHDDADSSLLLSKLPIIDIKDVDFNSRDEIGRGSFGVVYKGVWAGTPIALKHIKLRNAKRMQPVFEAEVQVHSMLRHPNIVQIMAMSLLKNSVYIVSELVDGFNLEDILFCDKSSEAHSHREMLLQGKVLVAKQICQAVTYLHQLKPAVVHRDIKPANVLVDKKSVATKLCDMGLSKIKTGIATTATNGVPGTI